MQCSMMKHSLSKSRSVLSRFMSGSTDWHRPAHCAYTSTTAVAKAAHRAGGCQRPSVVTQVAHSRHTAGTQLAHSWHTAGTLAFGVECRPPDVLNPCKALEDGCSECDGWVHQYTVSKDAGNEWPG